MRHTETKALSRKVWHLALPRTEFCRGGITWYLEMLLSRRRPLAEELRFTDFTGSSVFPCARFPFCTAPG